MQYLCEVVLKNIVKWKCWRLKIAQKKKKTKNCVNVLCQVIVIDLLIDFSYAQLLSRTFEHTD